MAVEQADAPEQRVDLSVEGPRPQNRWTVAFRFVLAFPHVCWMAILGVVGFFAVVIAWFVALVLGRMPRGIGAFVASILEYQTRVYAYGYLLTDRYPPFTLQPADPYPAELEISDLGRLNRAAVLFRAILLVPAFAVVSLVSGGMTVILFVLWLIVLITGRMPDMAFEALAVTLRYQLRVWTYACMLTSRYPGGVLGDRPEVVDDDGVDVDALDDAMPPPVDPRIDRFVLSKGGKAIVIAAIVIGVFTNRASATRFHIGQSDAAKRLDSAHDALDVDIHQFTIDAQACAAAADPSCIREADGRLIAALESFRTTLAAVKLPSGALGAASRVDDDASDMISQLRQLQELSDPSAAQSIAAKLDDAGRRFDQDYQQLYANTLFGN